MNGHAIKLTVLPPSHGAPFSTPSIMSSPTLVTTRAGTSKDACQISSAVIDPRARRTGGIGLEESF
jgi:hypothetical protein